MLLWADSVMLGRLVFMGGNGLSVLTSPPYHLHANDTSQFLIEGLGVLIFLDVARHGHGTDIWTVTIAMAFLSYFLMHDVRILVILLQS
jgi:hypothetical protein